MIVLNRSSEELSKTIREPRVPVVMELGKRRRRGNPIITIEISQETPSMILLTG
jgi:hypothetical protein